MGSTLRSSIPKESLCKWEPGFPNAPLKYLEGLRNSETVVIPNWLAFTVAGPTPQRALTGSLSRKTVTPSGGLPSHLFQV